MENKRPQSLSIASMFEKMGGEKLLSDSFYYSDGFLMGMDLRLTFSTLFTSPPTPYLLNDYRMGIVRHGEIRGYVNMRDYHVHAGSAVFIVPGTIAEPVQASPDLSVMGMAMPPEMLRLALGDRLPDLFNGQRKAGVLVLDEDQQMFLETLFRTLFLMVNHPAASRAAVLHFVATIAQCYDDFFRQNVLETEASDAAHAIYDRFIALVNAHCREQRQLRYYADCICVTERHLGTVVRQVSGVTAKEWIDRAVVLSAKVMLRHGDRSVSQIADDLHFANTSFFCKYFRRVCGCTPQEYRAGR